MTFKTIDRVSRNGRGEKKVPASPYAASAGETLVPTAAAPMRTVRAKRRETAAPSSSLAACLWARQTS